MRSWNHSRGSRKSLHNTKVSIDTFVSLTGDPRGASVLPDGGNGLHQGQIKGGRRCFGFFLVSMVVLSWPPRAAGNHREDGRAGSRRVCRWFELGKVIPLLQAKGLKVVAVQNPLTSLADDVAAATKRAIKRRAGRSSWLVIRGGAP